MTTLLRYRDLVTRKIVTNRVTLKRLQEERGFPRGRMVGPNVRAWIESEIDEWVRSQPEGGPPLRGVAKTRRGRPGPRKKGVANTDPLSATNSDTAITA